jgi:hypothetical protein
MALEEAGRFGNSGPNLFTGEQRAALMALRDRRLIEEGFLNDKQLAHLSFVRWLCRTGRLTSDTAPARVPRSE